ncbi:MAG TPA: alanine--tRNA ligase [Flavobacteriaceae bacterium]|nr:alanine--tRNA ligase [Flavobacteriaceae bacterium]
MTSKEIRERYLSFFKSKGHTIVPSAPMVLKGDPTLMFTNAGMVPFKEYFLGNKPVKHKRIADTQKCLRVSGKHNDLEEVGMDTYHHTMFEMLGNWSFGDYFKKEAIAWAWELLTEVYKIDKDNLYVSIFEGDASENLERDQEAYDLWKEYVPADRIIEGNKEDNFWEMGPQGPCGPCSEIHVDIRSAEEKAKVNGADLVNKDHPQVVEIWNLVFMQFNRKADGSLEELPQQHVDTGMGFERLCMVLQDKQSNYDTDVFMPIIREIETITSTSYEKGDEDIDIAIRVIADHVRAVAFAIADGQLPSNSGAGYVIRRILRRAVRYGFTFLDKKEAFIYQLVPVLLRQLGEAFPELIRERNLIVNVIREEENSFLRTLEQGLILLDNIIEQNDGDIVSGSKAFELYDTYGFPIDLTALILRERGMKLDEKVFEEELQKQRQRSREATKLVTGDWVQLREDDKQEFVGYDLLETSVKIVRYRKVSSKREGELYQLVFNLTPFYAEGGGQVGDKGYLKASNGVIYYIEDTKEENNLTVHYTKTLPEKLDDTFTAVVDKNQRSRSAANHTATHLLHQALKEVLGDHVEQKGSMVQSRTLRFDFSHFSKLTDEELKQVEEFVNARIRESIALEEQRTIPYDMAIEQGAVALFGERYGDTVRTIKFGNSIELCGGTHVENTIDIWHFIITSESAVAAGVRRIEAITGDAAKQHFMIHDALYNKVRKSLNNTKDPLQAIQQLKDSNAKLEKQVEELLKDKAKNLKQSLKSEFEEVNGVQLLIQKVDLNAGAIRDLAFELGGEVKNACMLFGSDADGKVTLTCYIDKELAASKNWNAGTIVRQLSKYIQGGGGGQAFFATAGGRNPEGIDAAFKEFKEIIL